MHLQRCLLLLLTQVQFWVLWILLLLLTQVQFLLLWLLLQWQPLLTLLLRQPIPRGCGFLFMF
jgi:hypothetical protein